MAELDPKVRAIDIIYNYFVEISAPLPSGDVFLPSAKHVSISSLT